MLKMLRILVIGLGLSLMIGELWRSWGAGRHWLFVIDDQIMGIALIAGAWAMRRDTQFTRAAFAAAWAFNAGMLYDSFFGKLIEPESSNPSNWDLTILTALIGAAFALSIIGLIATLWSAADNPDAQLHLR